MTDIDKLRYPVGPMSRVATPLDSATRRQHLQTLEETPARIRALVSGLSNRQLDTPYRPGGWTVRQVVHHLPDSHMNAYIRHKLAVTERMPAVKTYEEQLWAELPEAKSGSIDMSVDLLDALHRRWIAFLRALPEAQLEKTFSHPEWKSVTVDESIAMYAWHCRHHTAHIEQALQTARQ
ncbi:MAG TPA: putative metal-dependent hydrolase [Vicinamibacterales bacterium]|nr:putative metal-dependent hydrolase [Vicinamibacterales bacterium]